MKNGTIERAELCSSCGNPPGNGYTRAHHDDYAKPLEVRWLCGSCHKKQHGNGRLGAPDKRQVFTTTYREPLTVEKVAAALTLANGNVSEAARMLGVSRVTIYKWKARITKERAA